MKHRHLMSAVFAFIAILTLGGAMIFSGLDEPRNALTCAAISALCGVLKFLLDQLGLPKNWSNVRSIL